MAIADIKRINIAGHYSIKSRIIEFLRRTASVQLIEDKKDSELTYGEDNLETLIQDISQEVQEIKETIGVLQEYTPDRSFLEKIRQEPERLKWKEFAQISEETGLEDQIKEVLKIKNKIPSINTELDSLSESRKNLLPWKDLEINTCEISSTAKVDVYTAKVSVQNKEIFNTVVETCQPYISVRQVSETEKYSYVEIVVLKNRSEELMQALSEVDFEVVFLPDREKNPAEIIGEIDDRTLELNSTKKSLSEQLSEIADNLSRIQYRYDFKSDRKAGLAVRRYIGCTEKTFLVQGWVLTERAEDIRGHIHTMGPVKVDVFDPGPEDPSPPVDLVNPKILAPFEFITELYGTPSAKEKDPTLFLAPFFFLFFGLCLSDGGYGVILTAVMLVFMMVLGIKGKIYSLFAICGVATICAGAVTGTWLGVNVSELPEGHWAGFLKSFVMFDPMSSEPGEVFGLSVSGTMAFFYLSIVLGYIQVVWGTFISAVNSIRLKKWISGICDDGAWLIAYAGLACIALSREVFFGFTSYGIESLLVPGTVMALTGLCIRLVVHPVLEPLVEDKQAGAGAIPAKFGISIILILNNMKDLLGNVLSYCRIMALGLATAVIGTVVNQLAMQSLNMAPVIGVIVMVMLLAGGHLFNLLINLLGAFVHTARLQYVEFFPYFFMGGGERFKPLKREFEYINIEE